MTGVQTCALPIYTLSIVTKMLLSVEFKVDRCAELAGKNFATATDLADIMVREKQIPFRTAHKIVGRIVNEASASSMAEEDITSKFIFFIFNYQYSHIYILLKFYFPCT